MVVEVVKFCEIWCNEMDLECSGIVEICDVFCEVMLDDIMYFLDMM